MIGAIFAADKNLSIEECSNGYILDLSGRDENDDWVSEKRIYTSWEELLEALEEWKDMPKN